MVEAQMQTDSPTRLVWSERHQPYNTTSLNSSNELVNSRNVYSNITSHIIIITILSMSVTISFQLQIFFSNSAYIRTYNRRLKFS